MKYAVKRKGKPKNTILHMILCIASHSATTPCNKSTASVSGNVHIYRTCNLWSESSGDEQADGIL